MRNDDGLKVVESKRSLSRNGNDSGILEKCEESKIGNVVNEHFGDILNLASDIVEIKKMQVQSSAIIEKMKEDRKMLLAEAEVYVKKKNADTSSVVERMRVIQSMMKDFYEANNTNISGEEFSKVITEIVTQMGRVE